MNSETITTMILSSVTSFGAAALVILGTLITVIVGFLVFRKGLWALLHDQSLTIGGFYVRNVPYKGYNRFRSRSWNMAHMP